METASSQVMVLERLDFAVASLQEGLSSLWSFRSDKWSYLFCVSCREPGLPSSVFTDPACTLQTQPKSVLRAQTSVRNRLTLQGMLKVEDWFAQKHLGIYSVISCSPQKWQLIYCVRKPWHAGGRRRTQ